jgi:hypothetical protein
MRLSSVGPNTIIEALDPERTDPPVKTEGVSAPQASQLETESNNTTDEQMVAGNLTNLIEEAKKRAEARKKKGLSIKRSHALEAYKRVIYFEDMHQEIGGSLDQSS